MRGLGKGEKYSARIGGEGEPALSCNFRETNFFVKAGIWESLYSGGNSIASMSLLKKSKIK